MAKRNKPAGEADDSQNEFDFERPEGSEGTIDAPAAGDLNRQNDWPRLEKHSDLNDRSEAEREIPQMALPSLELNGGAWTMADEMPAGAGAGMRSFRIRRIAALAAIVALSAAFGGLAGSMITTNLATSSAATSDAQASTQRLLTRMEQEVGALRMAVETAARDAQGKTARIAERLDRNERAQAAPFAKLAKISEAVERLDRRTAPVKVASASANAGDITGSIGASQVAVPKTKPANIISGWTLHDVYDGVALIKGRAGLVEVWPGDMLPQIGRIEAIRKQDGHWVVVTSRGMIVDR